MQSPPHTRDPSPKKGSIVHTLRGPNLTTTTIASWKKTIALLAGAECTIDGESLDISAIVAVGK